MRIDALVREIVADVRSGTARLALLATVVGALGAGLCALDVLTVRGLLHDAATYRESGAAVLTLAAPGGIDGERCRALAQTDGVTASAALRAREQPLIAAALPDAPLPAYDVTGDIARLLGGGVGGRAESLGAGTPGAVAGVGPHGASGGAADAIGAAVPSDVADELLGRLGPSAPAQPNADRATGAPSNPLGSIATAEGPLLVGSVYAYPADGRRPGFGWAALIPAVDTSAPFDECWISAWPQSDDTRSLLLTALRPGADAGDDRPELGQLNASLGLRFDGAERFSARLTAWAPLTATILAALLAGTAVWTRRLQIASDLHAGVRRRDVIVILLVETLAWAAAGALLTLGAAALLAAPIGGRDGLALIAGAVPTVLGMPVGALVGAAVVAASIRERHLFRYFKDRR